MYNNCFYDSSRRLRIVHSAATTTRKVRNSPCGSRASELRNRCTNPMGLVTPTTGNTQ